MKQKPFLLVLGMHRSGTSALAGVMDRLGFGAGGDVLEPQQDNPKGFWENAQIVALHDAVLGKLGSSWDDPLSLDIASDTGEAGGEYIGSLKTLLHESFDDVLFPYVKDPRLSQLLGLWKPLLKELEWSPRCLIIVRRPAEVAESLRKRNDMDIRSALLLWLRSNINIEYKTRGLKRHILSYESLLDDPAKELRLAMAALDYAVPGDEIINAAISHIDKSQRHNEGALHSSEVTGDYGLMAEKVHSALLSLGKGESNVDSNMLDQCRSEIEKYESICLPWVDSRRRMSENAVKQVKRGIEDAYQTLINEKFNVDVNENAGNTVAESLAVLDALVVLMQDRIEHCESRVMASENKMHESDNRYHRCSEKLAISNAELDACRARMESYESKPIINAVRIIARSMLQKIRGRRQ